MTTNAQDLKKTVRLLIEKVLLDIEGLAGQGELEQEGLLTLIDNLSVLVNEVGLLYREEPLLDLTELNEKLEMLFSALQEGDNLIFIDLLLYELKPLLEYWLEELTD